MQPPPRLVRFRFEPRALDVDRAETFARCGRFAARIDLGRTEAAQLICELAGARRAGVRACAERRFQTLGRRWVERSDQALGKSNDRLRRRVGCDRIRAGGQRSGREPLELVHFVRERTAPRLAQLKATPPEEFAGTPFVELVRTELPSLELRHPDETFDDRLGVLAAAKSGDADPFPQLHDDEMWERNLQALFATA
jgi:hypothetical protein